MAKIVAPTDSTAAQVLLETFVVNDRMNQMILENLDARAWQARPQGRRVRTIAAIFTHMHNIRRKWIRLSAPHLKLPAQLDRARCTQKQARVALRESGRQCAEMIAQALAADDHRVKQFHRDGWATPWPAGAAMVAYMITHEAHHRGQICMLAHQSGFPLPKKTAYGMWSWEKLWKECGLTSPR